VSGFVASLSHPGGNVTGVSNLNAVIESKRLGLLREIEPAIATVGALLNPDSLTAVGQQKDIEQVAQTVGLRVQFLKASNEPELEAAFQAIIENRIPALLVPADAFFAASRERIAELAVQNGVPATKPADLPVLQPTKFQFVIQQRYPKSGERLLLVSVRIK
jgi:putative tryptophan/tyrosine transport system substrate-binding protein